MKHVLPGLPILFLAYLALGQNSSVNERIPLTKDNLSLLNGSYEIFSVDTSYRTLDFCLAFIDHYHFTHRPDSNDKVTIKAIDGKHLIVTVYKGDSILKQKKLRGAFVDGKYAFRAVSLLPLMLFNVYRKEKIKVGRLSNGDLILDTYIVGVLFIFILPTFCGKDSQHNLVFRKKEGSK